VLKVDHNPGHVSGGSGGQYFVGDFDGCAFVPEHPTDEPRWVDRGADFYGALPFAGEPSSAERTWIAWMSNWDYAHDTPTTPWRGAMSLPRRIALIERDHTHVLVQRPIDTLDARREPLPFPVGSDAVVHVPHAYRLRLVADGPGLTIRLGFGDEAVVVVSYDREAASLTVDRSAAGERPNDRFSLVHTASVRADGPIDLDVVVDRSSIEVFADEGTLVFTDLIFPPAGQRTITITGSDTIASEVRLDTFVR
jgi:sucrose-6-phosphate hydrolase SacC (GH32 family)